MVGATRASDLETTRELSASAFTSYRLEQQGCATASVTVDVLDVVPDWERLRADLDRVSRTLTRMRQRIVAPLLPITAARWVTDPDFDLDHHLRRICLPEPGSFRQLLEIAETVHSMPLDPRRPLWEATLIEGLRDREDASAAIVWKFSHVVPDGVGSTAFEREFWAPGRGTDSSPMPPLPSPEDLSSIDLTRRELRRLPLTGVRRAAKQTGDAARLVASTARSPVAAVGQLAHAVASLPRATRRPPIPMSPVLRRRGLLRRVDVLDVDLAALRTAASKVGCSLHDAYVAAVLGGLRIYHEQLGVPVDVLPAAMSMPVEADEGPAINRWSGALVAAPVGEVDPVVRMDRVRDLVLTADEQRPSDLLHVIGPVAAWLPDQVVAAIGDGPASGIDVNIGTRAGHVHPVHVADARVVGVVPIGPLFGAAMTILLHADDDRGHVGVHVDAVAVSDPDLLLDCLRQGFDEVIGVARTRSRRRSR